MSKFLTIAVAVFVMASWAGAADSTAQPDAKPDGTPKKFIVYDNIGYTGKPDTTAQGLLNCTIVKLGKITKANADSVDEGMVKDAVRKAATTPGPLVFDLEYIYNFKLFLNLVQWSHEAVPGSVVGFYGHGLFPDPPSKAQRDDAAALAKSVDAFFPSMYTFDDNQKGWKNKLTQLVQEAHRISPGKPIYPYLWPQYHKGSAKGGQFIKGDYWKFQLETAQECGADGVVIWSGNPAWNEKADWWQETVKFVAGHPMVVNASNPNDKNAPSPLDDPKKYGD